MIPRLYAIAMLVALMASLAACTSPADTPAATGKHGVVWSEGDGSCGVPGIDPAVGFGPFSC